MENISIKLDKGFLAAIEKAMKKNNYSTKTEFIREAVRDKLRQIEKEELLRNVERLAGSSKRKTTDEQLHAAGERAVKRLEKKFGMN